jgi:hypothetical protein
VHPTEHLAFRLAALQCGLFSRRQLPPGAATDSLIHRRVATGRWIIVLPGVYSLPGHDPSFRRSLWLAYLAAPPEAVVSDWSGGWARRLDGFPPNRLTLTIPHGCYPRHPIAVVRQTLSMPKFDLLDGLPVASVERILIDVAASTGPKKLSHLVEAARSAGRTTPVRLRSEFLRLARPGRAGIATMRQVLAQYEEGPPPPRSELERLLDRILGRIPVDVHHEAPLPGREWSAERVDRRIEMPRRLIVEGDSRRWHTRVADFRRDRERDRAALRAGYPTVRYVYEELRDEGAAVEAELRDLLGLPER